MIPTQITRIHIIGSAIESHVKKSAHTGLGMWVVVKNYFGVSRHGLYMAPSHVGMRVLIAMG